MPCEDCREFRREMFELKEFVAKWFSILLKRFDCQDRKLISLTEAICGEDLYDIMNDPEDNIQSNLHSNKSNASSAASIIKKLVKQQQQQQTEPVAFGNEKLPENNDDFKTVCDKTSLADFTNEDFINNSDEPCLLTGTKPNRRTSSSKRRKFAKPNRKWLPVVKLKEETNDDKLLVEKIIDCCENEGESDDAKDLNDELNDNIIVSAEETVPSTSSDCLEGLHEGQRFDSMNDFIFSLTRYEESRSINLIVADSKKVETANKRVKPGSLPWDTKFKYCYFELRCSRAGVGEQCPFRLLVINSKTERRLVITKMVDAHHLLCAQNGNDEAARMRLLKRLL